jgi:hypothetical protein
VSREGARGSDLHADVNTSAMSVATMALAAERACRHELERELGATDDLTGQ